jgi:tetratricopeptide (TPR) repeat protein
MKSNITRHIILILLSGFTAIAYAQTDRQLVREGNRFFTKGQYDKAEVQYRKAVEKNPSNPQALYNLGCALMMQNKDSAAIVQYQKATKIEKNKLRLASVYHNIGVVCQNHKMYGDAIKAYEQSLRNNPKDDETRYNLALCKKMQKNNKDDNKNKNNDNNKQQKNKDRNNNKEKDKDKQKQPKEQISKDNAEQLINAAIQNEKATQQRLNKALQKTGTRKISDKNW